jgi:hypothetical protein
MKGRVTVAFSQAIGQNKYVLSLVLRLHGSGANGVGFIEDVGDIAVEDGGRVEGDAETAAADVMRDDGGVGLRHQHRFLGARPPSTINSGSRTQSDPPHDASP